MSWPTSSWSEGDRVEPPLGVLEDVDRREGSCARQAVADKLPQVSLAGDEAHDRCRPVRCVRLDQPHDLGAFPAHEGDVAHARRQPQDQLVEEKHHRVVTKALGMSADGVQAGVQRHEALGGRPRLARERSVVGPQQRPDQLVPFS